MVFRRRLSRSRVIGILAIAVVLLVIGLIALLATGRDVNSDDDSKKGASHDRRQLQADIKPPDPKPYAFPQGGAKLLPGYRFVALYGTPASKHLGALGEQPLDKAVIRAKKLAATYQAYTSQHVYPTFEIIASVASASATADGDYSNELKPESLRPWVDAAKKAGVYVVLDLQPGREHFLSQAKQYESLLKEPHVGLALDPEWRLKPSQVHLEQIGSVRAAEVNAVSGWLDALVKKHDLPQKVFLLHQFRLSMITQRNQLRMHDSLAYMIQMDGNGAQPTKADTWRTLLSGAPKGIYFGWKNFYDEDHPMLGPAQTMALEPQPWYVSYQ